MTDLHTHILPGMDDGARDADESIKMLRQERAQGVDTVVLTPHFYRDRESPARFLRRRAAAFEQLNLRLSQLPEEERADLPRLILGAEVAWNNALTDCDEIGELCIGSTSNLLLELPFTKWNDRTFGLIYELMGQTGITPVIAHLERYLKLQKKEYIRDVLELDVPIQVGTDALRVPLLRGKILKMLQRGQLHVLASDCHDAVFRMPNMNEAMDMVRRKLGEQQAKALICFADGLVEP